MAALTEQTAVRGFIPPRNDEERFIMRRAEDLARSAAMRSMPRHSGFLSDREQDLSRAALNRCGCKEYSFVGGYADAERKVLQITPEEACWQETPVQCLCIQAKVTLDAQGPEHKDFLGSLLGLEIERTCIGDILLDPDSPGRALAFVLEDKVDFICRELRTIGRFNGKAEPCEADMVNSLARIERTLKTGTVPSLRLDAVLSEIMATGRGTVADLIAAGRVEINHVPEQRQHASVYAGDVFTVRGKGKYKLNGIKGKSRKDRFIIEYYQY